VCAVIRQREGTTPLEVEALRVFLAERLADYKHPRKVVRFVEPLPRNAMGKLDKTTLLTVVDPLLQ
jgi:non-ribosomal peptide synthetase component E (peptide arylation enzyme)